MPRIKPEFYHVNLTLSRNGDTYAGWSSETQVEYNVAIPVEFFNATTLSRVIAEYSKQVDALWVAHVAKEKAEEEAAELERQAQEAASAEDEE